jgi:hypothetical protein
MFFKVGTGCIKPVHEWLNWAMVAGVVLHTIANWKAFLSYFSKIPAVSIISVGLVVTALAVFLPASREGNPRMKMARAIESARLESVAEITGKESSEIISALEEKGIAVEDPTMSVREIARTNHREPMEVLGVVFR